MNFKSIILSIVSLISLNFCTSSQIVEEDVKVSGAMSNVMKKGQLEGTIFLDTIQNKKHLYGIGPKEFLKGELLIIDGKSYVSSVGEDNRIIMKETFDVKAPFFVYANNNKWKEYTLPSEVITIKELEDYINEKTKDSKRPFVFKLKGNFARVNFHIQNLPDGTIVKSHKDAHQGQGKYEREDIEGEIVGFFSTEHQSVFTHHDSYIHIHFINKERTEMGHIDDLIIDENEEIILYLPN